jgi:transposase
MEQRYRAVLQVQAGVPVTEVADAFGVSRQAVHRWLRWYRDEGLAGLADGSHRPHEHPWQIDPAVEAAICEMRRDHPRWGNGRLAFELGRQGVLVRSRRRAPSAGCWCGTVSSTRFLEDGVGRITNAGNGRNRCNCGSWTSPTATTSWPVGRRRSSLASTTAP